MIFRDLRRPFCFMQNEAFDIAVRKVEAIITSETTEYVILMAMLKGPEGEDFIMTRNVVVQQINESDDLEALALEYDNKFIKLFLSRGGGSNSTPESSNTGSVVSGGSSRRKGVPENVKERDINTCVLTGRTDSEYFEVAHIIPFSLANKLPEIKKFISTLVPWMDDDFFSTIDTCENAIYLNSEAHILFGKFKWFITVDNLEETDPLQNVYRASQVEDRGELNKINTGRFIELKGITPETSSFGKELFIGSGVVDGKPNIPRPSKQFVKLHELLSRIIYIRGGAEECLYDSGEEFEDIKVYANDVGYKDKVERYLDQMREQY